MRKINPSSEAIDELLNRFVALSIEQGKANYVFAIAHSNRLGASLHEISTEIKRRPGDGGRSLLQLFKHKNTQVRFNAATSVSGVFTLQAREILEQIAGSHDTLAFDAKMYLRPLDEWMQKQKLP